MIGALPRSATRGRSEQAMHADKEQTAMTSDDVYIGLYLGTSSLKGVALDAAGRAVS